MIINLIERIRLSEEARLESHFSRDELEVLFAAIDSNHDGFIERSELKDFLVSHCMLATQKEQDYLMARFDDDTDSRINIGDLFNYFLVR